MKVGRKAKSLNPQKKTQVKGGQSIHSEGEGGGKGMGEGRGLQGGFKKKNFKRRNTRKCKIGTNKNTELGKNHQGASTETILNKLGLK